MKEFITLNNIKEKLNELKGTNVKMLVNRGRKKVEEIEGEIDNLYPSVFTVKIDSLKGENFATYSYTEVLCGHVKIISNKN